MNPAYSTPDPTPSPLRRLLKKPGQGMTFPPKGSAFRPSSPSESQCVKTVTGDCPENSSELIDQERSWWMCLKLGSLPRRMGVTDGNGNEMGPAPRPDAGQVRGAGHGVHSSPPRNADLLTLHPGQTPGRAARYNCFRGHPPSGDSQRIAGEELLHIISDCLPDSRLPLLSGAGGSVQSMSR
jgi:hypothetical protein